MSLLDLNQAQLAEMVGANIGTLKTEEAELEKTRRAISRLLDPFA